MTIKFENYDQLNDEDCTSKLKIITRLDKSIYLSLSNEFFNGGKDDRVAFFELEPKQLSDIIGALLHIQSKLRK